MAPIVITEAAPPFGASIWIPGQGDGFSPGAIERQLAPGESNKVCEDYAHFAQCMAERTRMMQAWADYLDGLHAGGKVVAIKRKTG